MLLDVSPRSSKGYRGDDCLADSKPVGEFRDPSAACPLTPYGSDVFFCQFGAGVLGASQAALSVTTLIHHVRVVVGARAKEHVIGVYAARIVAAVTQAHTGWDGAVRKLPSVTMRPDDCSRSRSELTVSLGRSRFRPVPTRVSLFDVTPKTRNRVGGSVDAGHVAGVRTVPARGSSPRLPASLAEFVGKVVVSHIDLPRRVVRGALGVSSTVAPRLFYSEYAC